VLVVCKRRKPAQPLRAGGRGARRVGCRGGLVGVWRVVVGAPGAVFEQTRVVVGASFDSSLAVFVGLLVEAFGAAGEGAVAEALVRLGVHGSSSFFRGGRVPPPWLVVSRGARRSIMLRSLWRGVGGLRGALRCEPRGKRPTVGLFSSGACPNS